MTIVCAASNCKYSSESEDSSNVTFINFPNNDMAKLWARSCGRSDLAAKSNAELHLNYYICSHHIEDRYYISKTIPIIIEQDAIPTLFGTNSNINNDDSINIFSKSQHLEEIDDNMPVTYCNINVDFGEYQAVTIKLSNLCRICGESTLDGIDIFTAKGIEPRLKEKINLLMPIVIDIGDSMPQKVCIDCCNKLELTYSLVVTCLRTDIQLKRLLNIEREKFPEIDLRRVRRCLSNNVYNLYEHILSQPEYENKYNALVEECLLEVAQEICMDENIHPTAPLFTTHKKVKPNLETVLKDQGNGACINTQNSNFENITKSIIPSELNTLIQTYKYINNDADETLMEKISETRRDKVQEEGHNILHLQSQTFNDTQKMFENHKILPTKKESVSTYPAISGSTGKGKHRNELDIKNSQTCNESKKLYKPKICESMQTMHCSVCSQIFKCQQDFDDHKYLHLTVDTTTGPSKKCGHCREVYHNRKELLNHITQSHERRLLFRCFACDKAFEKWSSLDIHEATHRTDKPYLCDLCGKSFKHSNNLRGHKRIHLDESIKKKHVCEICGSAFRSRFHLREHTNQHDGNRPYSCEQCGKAFYKRIQLRQHNLSHGSNKHTCPICGATFNRRGNMSTHVKRHSNGDGSYTCSICAYKCISMSELKIHRKEHTEEEIVNSIRKKGTDTTIWQCNVCQKVFSKRTILINHERIHGGDKLYIECDECGKKLASKSSLIYHKKSMHLGEKSHMCHYCGNSFVSREGRLIHERVHTGERPYVCKVCSMRYRCSSHLSQHMKIHTGLKPHKCQYCNKVFTRKGALTIHERIHTGIKPYPCEICGRTFSQKNDMLKHVKTHNAKLTQCDQCHEIFKKKKDMLKHTAQHEQNISLIQDADSSPSVLRSYTVTISSSEIK